jgi:hypothetical protein
MNIRRFDHTHWVQALTRAHMVWNEALSNEALDELLAFDHPGDQDAGSAPKAA